MNRIAIIGAPGTGKSIISNSLSIISGISLLNEKKITLDDGFLNGSIYRSNTKWVDTFRQCLDTFSSRVINEKLQCESGFISDGSVLNEIVLNMANIATQERQVAKYRFLKRRIISKLGEEYTIMMRSLLNVALTYARENYDSLLWLVPSGDGERFHSSICSTNTYNEILESLHLDDLGFSVCKYSTDSYQVTLKKMVIDLGLKPIYSPENALFMTQDRFHYKSEIMGMNSDLEKIVLLKVRPIA